MIEFYYEINLLRGSLRPLSKGYNYTNLSHNAMTFLLLDFTSLPSERQWTWSKGLTSLPSQFLLLLNSYNEQSLCHTGNFILNPLFGNSLLSWLLYSSKCSSPLVPVSFFWSDPALDYRQKLDGWWLFDCSVIVIWVIGRVEFLIEN